MKKLLFTCAVALSLCAFGSLARAGTEYVEGGNYQRPAPVQQEEPRSYIPLLPPLPFLPVPTLVVGGHGPAPAVVPVGGPVIVGGPGYVGYGYGYRRRWRRRWGPYGYRGGYYGGPGPGVAVGARF